MIGLGEFFYILYLTNAIMKKLFILFIITYPMHSQCTDEKIIPFTDGSSGIYTGCLDDFGNPSGKGVLLMTDIFRKEGLWQSGKLNGKGKIIYLEDNSILDGLWVNDNLINGTYYRKNETIEVTYEGEFENRKFQGLGVLKIIEPDRTTLKEGAFINNDLFQGEEIVSFTNSLKITSNIDRGKSVKQIRNDVNYYDLNDVEGDESFSIIEIRKEGTENEGVSFLIEMEIEGIKGEWVFDTGAQSFSIGQRMFKRLVSQGVTYRDLKRTIKTLGVGGESSGRLIILDNIKIGNYTVNNVKAEISNDNNYSLMGVSFLNKFGDVEWSMKKNQIILYKERQGLLSKN